MSDSEYEFDSDDDNDYWANNCPSILHYKIYDLTKHGFLCVDLEVLMALTLEPPLMETLNQAINNLPPGSKFDFLMDLSPAESVDYCLNPPSDEAFLATATQVAELVSSKRDLLGNAGLNDAPAFLAVPFLATLVLANMFRITNQEFPDAEYCDAFCRTIESSSLALLSMTNVSFDPEHEVQVARRLAHCNTLELFDYEGGASEAFVDSYCEALSENFDTKLIRLRLHHGDQYLDITGAYGSVLWIEPEVYDKVRNLLSWNMQRKTCPPLLRPLGLPTRMPSASNAWCALLRPSIFLLSLSILRPTRTT